MDNILTVRELNMRLRQLLEQRFPYVWVRGEVTNCSRPSSGHVYFSLKDGTDLLNCVWFRTSQKTQSFDPLTGEVWEDGPRPSLAQRLEDGQEYICAGRLGIYGARGQYQLLVELAEECGAGQLYAEFEALKRKLSAEGLFDAARKRPLPRNPQRVAVITAPSGAVIQDFLRISSQRGLSARIRLYPSPVQGVDAPPKLLEALAKAQKDGFAEVIALIRGGGSIQDLWAFNDERLARAIAACSLPVITGIGHEPDHSIADYAADYSAATPSHVAQMLWEERASFVQQTDLAEESLTAAFENFLAVAEKQLASQSRTLELLSPVRRLMEQKQRVQEFSRRLRQSMLHRLDYETLRVHTSFSRLRLPDYKKSAALLAELAYRQQRALQRLITAQAQRSDCGSRLLPAFAASVANAAAQQRRLTEKLTYAGEKFLSERENRLEKLALRLENQNPSAPLQRGYALVRGESGQVLRRSSQLLVDDKLKLEFCDGMAGVRVTEIPNKN